MAALRQTARGMSDDEWNVFVAQTRPPDDAKAGIEQARVRIKTEQDAVIWPILQLHAAEAVHEQAHAKEKPARRAVIAEEYTLAHAEYNDPKSRESVLLAQLESAVAELI